MNMLSKFVTILSLFSFTGANAQIILDNTNVSDSIQAADSISVATDTVYHAIKLPDYELVIDRADFDSIISNPVVKHTILPSAMLRVPVFDRYLFLDSLSIEDKQATADNFFKESYRWLDDLEMSNLLVHTVRQNFMIQNPNLVKYNTATLPEPPKQYHAFVNPITTRIEFAEQKVVTKPLEADIDKRHWLSKFSASLQFSQAFISPNWYQGGNDNLNMIAQLFYRLKLNEKFYPNHLFDMTIQYKLGVNSVENDSIRSHSINEDLFQFNLTAGIKAANRWFYSGNVTFKTQLFNTYPLNSRDVTSSFLSPGELNVGLGMTYNYSNAKKTFNINLSISPLSWNMKSCINNRVNETNIGIEKGRNLVNEIGSNIETNLTWNITHNISLASRLFAFTDYGYIQADWENSIDFAINKYLSTRLFVHARYDSTTPRSAERPKWHKLQLKEVFSFGLNYTFGVL